jgi:uncharacterized protein YbbC (DUF1343 family)
MNLNKIYRVNKNNQSIFELLKCLTIIFLAFTISESRAQFNFRLGNELLLSDYVPVLQNTRVAVLTNQTGTLPDGTHFIDALISKNINVVKIFSPEHGIRGDENYSDIDEKTRIPVISLYGSKFKPSDSDLNDIDVIIYDIQDVGARFYTYTSTLYYLIESAVENKKTVYVCDRPVIIDPDYTDGFMLGREFESFVGKIPTPVCYGMTCGELAAFLAGEVFFTGNVKVIKMSGYSRSFDYDSLNIKWIKPSPNIFTSLSAVCYPASCFLEGTNVSEGRGTPKPFEYFGAPWVNEQLLSDELNSLGLTGVAFEPVTFTPSEKISAYQPKFFNQPCSGIFIHVTDKKKFEPVKCGIAVLVTLNKLFTQFKFDNKNYIDKLAGTDKLRKMITAGKSCPEITDSWKDDLKAFNEKRSKYLLYQ